MSGWKAKRFWRTVEVSETADGWTIALDGRSVRTPAKAPLVLPSQALADAVATEWEMQEGEIAPETMPCTRSANAAIDKVSPQFEEVVELVAAYGDTDLCCYRADGPATLVRQQADAWDPLIVWASSALDVRLNVTTGIVPVAQPAASSAAFRTRVAGTDAFALTALHDLVALSGSLLIGLAAQEGLLPVAELWRRSRIDETFQENQWGIDAEAAATAARKRNEFLHAERFFHLSRPVA